MVALQGRNARMKSPYTNEASIEQADQGPPVPSHQGRQRQVRLSAERVDELVELYRSGASKAELARVFGINETTVRAHLRRRAVEHRPRRKLHGELLRQAAELYAAGWSLRSIGSELGVSREAVKSGLVAADVDLRAAR